MKSTTLDILIDIIDDLPNETQSYDTHRPAVANALYDAGINDHEIHSTLEWLDSVIEGTATIWEKTDYNTRNPRIFNTVEANKIPEAGKEFLKKLEKFGFINTITRERIIDSVMSCDTESIDFEQLQWIAFMVIANDAHHENDLPLLLNFLESENHAILAH